jgi:hypothetical protein
MDALQMLHPVVFAPEAFGGVALASNDWAEEFLFAMNCSLMAFQVPGVAEVADFAVGDCAFVRSFVLVHMSPFRRLVSL